MSASDGAGAGPSATAPPGEAVGDLPFDRALSELQAVVARLEAGGMALEESIGLYERGVALHERCAQLLSQAELRVQRLVDASGGPRTVDLRPDDGEP
jgi:exodeoxyribonuclease VII small subunit